MKLVKPRPARMLTLQLDANVDCVRNIFNLCHKGAKTILHPTYSKEIRPPPGWTLLVATCMVTCMMGDIPTAYTSQENVSPVVLSKNEKILEQLRHVQWKCNCSTATLQCILDSLNAELGDLIRANDDLPKNVKSADKKMQEMVSLRTRK